MKDIDAIKINLSTCIEMVIWIQDSEMTIYSLWMLSIVDRCITTTILRKKSNIN